MSAQSSTTGPATRVPTSEPASPASAGWSGLWRAESVLGQARALLDDALAQRQPADRFRIAHLAALRAAAALLLAVSPSGIRSARRPTSAWVLLDRLAPAFGEWSAYFAGRAGQRAAADAGAVGAVTSADAVEMVGAVRTFLELVQAAVTDAGTVRLGHPALPGAWGPDVVRPPRDAELSAAS